MTAQHLTTTTVRNFDIAELLAPYPGAAKLHDDPALLASVRENGQYRSVVVRALDDVAGYQILAGIGTVKALHAAGMDVRCEVIVCTDVEARRIVLADNRLGQLAGYDQEALLALLDAANADGGLSGTGFDPDAYADLLQAAAAETPTGIDDALPDVPENPLTRPGSTWILGRHILVCGSSLDPDVLTRATDDGSESIAAVHADPPYGIDIVKADGRLGGGRRRYKPVEGDKTTQVAADSFRLLTTTYPKARQIWWGANHYAGDAHLPNASCWLVWEKDNHGTGFADAELAWVTDHQDQAPLDDADLAWTNHPGAVRTIEHQWMGAARATERGPRMHPNQKPVAVVRWALETTLRRPSSPETIVLVPFAGSGPEVLACELLGCTCIAIELDPAYCDVIVRRWAELTGQVPILDGEPVELGDPMGGALGAGPHG